MEDPQEEFIMPPLPEDTVAKESTEDVPISPTKRLAVMMASNVVPPESPDMKFARNRLGNLLTSIRKGDAPALSPGEAKETVEETDKKGPGRPRKSNTSVAANTKSKNGAMIFELRGKSFALSEQEETSMYQLCRRWMRGQANGEVSPPRIPPDMEPCETIDNLVTSDIESLPRAQLPYPVGVTPDRAQFDVANVGQMDPENLVDLKKEYIRHWKSVKQTWKGHSRRRIKRYEQTTSLLEKIYNSAQCPPRV